MLEKPARLPVRQLVILSICRFAEPVVLTSVLPYLPEMIDHVGVPRSEVAKWVGITSAVTSFSQALMAVTWGTLSDTLGRKPIILVGLTCTMVFSLLFGFSSSLSMLVVSRALLGLMNGNVGIIRTMVAEMVPQKELQPRAFSIMPLVWTIGSIFGPAFGGALAKPAEKHPGLFGGSEFLRNWPFALPNIAAAAFFVVGIATGWLFLHETLAAKKHQRDYGLVVGEALTNSCTSSRNKKKSESHASDAERQSLLPSTTIHPATAAAKKAKPTWAEIFTPQSRLVLLAYALMSMHAMAFDSVLPVFLHSPVQQYDGNPDMKLPFKFTGGFGIDSQTIGIYYTLIGILGMFIQFLIFPWAAHRFGVLNCLKAVVSMFPIIYMLTPFTVLLPVPWLRNVAIFLLMFGKLAASIFGFPCTTILLTNSASSMSVLGTLNGVGTSSTTTTKVAALLAILTSVGGITGYLRARSLPSLIAGLSVSFLYLLSYLRLRANQPYGAEIGLLASIVLGGASIPRAIKTGKGVPTGLGVVAVLGVWFLGMHFLVPD
ncbi:MFS general substrate transporter [Aspergillus eucalypticola CBS 122712]|uniref:MFS general substrate transporter n=1 Tax=Aspergillus eucalypticola (strain CBS 122712 / IBT 29274) TaxID=1448314 RepID=A0A317VI18_ASPEC|nr:MFS general substrate transporter [Aspergillus eucalypticola CBS 122712]PWY73963.1 MFS general substrate transporter [Aspergillus eucalypticola CBS 122712]